MRYILGIISVSQIQNSLRDWMIFSAITIEANSCASLVWAPMCGTHIKLDNFKSILLVGGSISKTSSAAPAIFLVLSASYNASSSITSPRDVLMRNAVDFILENFSLFTIFLVSIVNGTWQVIKSALSNS